MSNESSDRTPILVELGPQVGVMSASSDPFASDLVQKSAKAIQSAMQTVEQMVAEVDATIDRLAGHPDKVEFSFGLTFGVEGDALIARAKGEAAIEVKVTWRQG